MKWAALLLIAATPSRVPAPVPAPLADAAPGARGVVNTGVQGFGGRKGFGGGVDTTHLDAGVVQTSRIDGHNSVAPLTTVAHNGANTFDYAHVWDVQPANTRSVDTYAWENGGVQGMGLDLSTTTYSSPSATPRLNVYGAVSPYQIDNRSSGSVRTIAIISNLAASAGTAAVTFDQATARTSDQCQYTFANGGDTYACFTPYSSPPFAGAKGALAVTGMIGASGDTSHGAFQVGQNGSGTVAMQCENGGSGCYLPFLCTESANYNTHGCVAFGNTGHLDGGMIVQAENPGGLGYTPGATTDNVFSVDVFGGFGQPMRGGNFPGASHALPLCPDPNAAVNTFGQGTTGSMLHWANDRNSYYVCRNDLNDGGTVGSATGYVQVLDQAALFPSETVDISERGGTSAFSTGTKAITFAPAFGSGTPHCICTSVDSAGTALACSRNTVSSTGATFVGSGSNAFDWHCWGKRF